MNWTDENVELLKKFDADGLSRGQIGDRLGCSRNSVCGKLNRLGLLKTGSQRPKRKRPRPRQPREVVVTNPPPYRPFNPFRQLKANKLASERLPPLTSDQKEYVLGAPIPEPVRKGIPLLDLAFDQCHWAINERKGFDDHLFCGAKGYPYCPHHTRMAYGSGTPSERRATEAA